MPRAAGILCLSALVASLACPAGAQTAGSPSQPATSKWEIDAYGGAAMSRTPAKGSITLPDAGAALTTSGPTFPSRRVSSWFFGDGAVLFNDVALQFDLPQRITPLDAAFGVLGIGGSTAAFGFRVRRTLTARLAAEGSVDVIAGRGKLTSAGLAAVEATRTSFETAFAGLLASGPFSNAVVQATSTTGHGLSRDVAVTGALSIRFARLGPFVPFATAGGGMMRGAGDPASVTLTGTYRFLIQAGTPVPIDESDRATVKFGQGSTWVGVLGGGLRRETSAKWGWRIDARVFLGRNGTRVEVDATPSVTRGTPAGFIESFTSPAIQFSNDPATGRISTLSGAALQNFEVFRGEGIQTHVLVTAGIFVRF
jgi:hypothetical protein